MRLIKYFFFLTLLLSFALVIFIATQQKTFQYNNTAEIELNNETIKDDLGKPNLWTQWLPLDSLNTTVSNLNANEFVVKDSKTKYEIKNFNDSLFVYKILDNQKILTKWQVVSNKKSTVIKFSNQLSLSFSEKLKSFFGRSIQFDLEKNQKIISQKLKTFFYNHYIFHEIDIEKVIDLNFSTYHQITKNQIKISDPIQLQDLQDAWYSQDTLFKKLNYSKSTYVQLTSPNFLLNESLVLYQEIKLDSLSENKKYLGKNFKQKLLKIKLNGNANFIPKAIKQAKLYYEEQNLEINNAYYLLKINNDMALLPPNQWEFLIYVPYIKKTRSYVIEKDTTVTESNTRNEQPLNQLNPIKNQPLLDQINKD